MKNYKLKIELLIIILQVVAYLTTFTALMSVCIIFYQKSLKITLNDLKTGVIILIPLTVLIILTLIHKILTKWIE